MAYRTLGLILAAGKGTRVQSVLEPDEPVKAMIKVKGERLVTHSMNFLRGAVDEIAVLSFPSAEYESLDAVVIGSGAKLMKQKAKQKKLPMLLELPYVLYVQYNKSEDKDYLRSFDSILTMPSDLVFENVDAKAMVRSHCERLKKPSTHQWTMMSRQGSHDEKADLFKMNGDRVVGWKSYRPGGFEVRPGWVISKQSGVYIFSQGLLRRPYMALGGVGFIHTYRSSTFGTWTDYGRPENVIAMRKR